MASFPKGSVWRRWDLHVHTPKSIVQDYGGDTPQAWDAFVGALRNLPADVAVVGITDPENSDEPLQQIENVIFQALDEIDKAGASDFRELQSNILAGYEFEKHEIVSAIKRYNKEFTSSSEAILSLAAKERELVSKRQELLNLQKNLPHLPPADQKAQEELAGYLEAKKTFEAQTVARRKLQGRIAEIETKLKLFAANAQKFESELIQAVKAVGITDPTAFTVAIDLAPMLRILHARRSELQSEIQVLSTGPKEHAQRLAGIDMALAPFSNYRSLLETIENRTAQTKAHETQKLKYQQQKRLLAECSQAIAALEQEMTRIKTEVIAARTAASQGRQDKYCEHFALLASEKAEIEKLYKPLQTTLDRGSDTDKRLRFEARYTYHLKNHMDKGLAIIDRTKKGNFRDIGALKQALDGLWTSFTSDNFIPAKIKEGLIAFHKRWRILDATLEKLTIESQLRDDYTSEDFFNWLLDPEQFEVVSSLTFDGTDLYMLSPGQKGIVLLMLYLGMDKTDTRPLLIDQPEDNLDNLAVYVDLIRLFRERKKYRQIIIITHNPNLVVNTDAEQVIVASYDGGAVPRIQYTSGSLENQAVALSDAKPDELTDGIIERVCDVLEGGPSAFEQRSKKYALSPKFVVTAAHVILPAHEHGKTIGITGLNRLVATAGEWMCSSPKAATAGDPYDVAVYALPDDSMRKLQGMTFLRVSDAGFEEPGPSAVFTLFGYPGAWSELCPGGAPPPGGAGGA